MKLQNQQRLTPQQISNLKRPNPPTEEAVKRAQFVDKTYQWQGR
jgi:hypothetical protein